MSENATQPAEAVLPPNKTITIPSETPGGDSKSYSLILEREDQEYYIDAGTRKFVEKEFAGKDFAGVRFFVPQLVGDDGYKTGVELWGGDKVTTMLNRQVNFDLALKAKARVGKYENTDEGRAARSKYVSNLLRTNPYIITPEDAEAYIPGTRELSFKGLLMKANEAQKNGDTAGAMEWLQKATAMAAREATLTA